MATTTTTTTARGAAAEKLSAQAVRTVTVAVDGEVYTYPDVAERYDRWARVAGGQLLGRWSADRQAADTFSKFPALEALHVWCYLDDEPVAYLVQYTRKPRSRMPHAEIVGAARHGK